MPLSAQGTKCASKKHFVTFVRLFQWWISLSLQ